MLTRHLFLMGRDTGAICHRRAGLGSPIDDSKAVGTHRPSALACLEIMQKQSAQRIFLDTYKHSPFLWAFFQGYEITWIFKKLARD